MTAGRALILSIVLLLTITSCNNSSQQQDTNKYDTTVEEKIPTCDTLLSGPSSLPNDKFRKAIISKITNQADLKKFDTLLTALDKKNVSFCQFVQRLYMPDDSCFAVAKLQFPAPSQQEDFAKVHDKAIEEAEAQYLQRLGLSSDFSTFVSVAYSFDQDIKQFCGDYN